MTKEGSTKIVNFITQALGEKSGFPKMETRWKPLGIMTSVVSGSFHFGETPMWFQLGFHTWKQSN